MKNTNKNSDNSTKIALVGYGSMGKTIERIATNNIQIVNIFNIDNPIEIKNYDFDVAIDFSTPSAVVDNVVLLSKLKKNIVIGTTGWYNDMEKVKQIVLDNEIGCVWGANFSIGMQIFFRVVEYVSKLDIFSNYDIFLSEIHHKYKKDSPSGTAKLLAEIINSNLGTDINISSIRGGYINGEHNVYIDSEVDTIELTHRAKNRNGFANGAIFAAKWIEYKQGFYNFENIYMEKI